MLICWLCSRTDPLAENDDLEWMADFLDDFDESDDESIDSDTDSGSDYEKLARWVYSVSPLLFLPCMSLQGQVT